MAGMGLGVLLAFVLTVAPPWLAKWIHLILVALVTTVLGLVVKPLWRLVKGTGSVESTPAQVDPARYCSARSLLSGW